MTVDETVEPKWLLPVRPRFTLRSQSIWVNLTRVPDSVKDLYNELQHFPEYFDPQEYSPYAFDEPQTIEDVEKKYQKGIKEDKYEILCFRGELEDDMTTRELTVHVNASSRPYFSLSVNMNLSYDTGLTGKTCAYVCNLLLLGDNEDDTLQPLGSFSHSSPKVSRVDFALKDPTIKNTRESAKAGRILLSYIAEQMPQITRVVPRIEALSSYREKVVPPYVKALKELRIRARKLGIQSRLPREEYLDRVLFEQDREVLDVLKSLGVNNPPKDLCKYIAAKETNKN